jgi:hypothetical protein
VAEVQAPSLHELLHDEQLPVKDQTVLAKHRQESPPLTAMAIRNVYWR